MAKKQTRKENTRPRDKKADAVVKKEEQRKAKLRNEKGIPEIDATINNTVESASERARIKEVTERLDALDVESAKNALNNFLESPDWTRYGCRIAVQGQFIENQMKAGILLIKNK